MSVLWANCLPVEALCHAHSMGKHSPGWYLDFSSKSVRFAPTFLVFRSIFYLSKVKLVIRLRKKPKVHCMSEKTFTVGQELPAILIFLPLLGCFYLFFIVFYLKDVLFFYILRWQFELYLDWQNVVLAFEGSERNKSRKFKSSQRLLG